MRGSESRMNTAVHFVEHLNGFPAQGQEFFVRGQGHSSVLRQLFSSNIIGCCACAASGQLTIVMTRPAIKLRRFGG
jgi:hypothetical protein